jgi:alpha-tubulin suppressor-like RCC1 family protein
LIALLAVAIAGLGIAPASATPQGTNAFVWGYNGHGGLGVGGTAGSAHPLALTLPSGATTVVVGADHTFTVDDAGRVWSWGGNGSGQLGDGSTTDRRSRVQVAFPAGIRIVQVSAYQDHVLALDTNGDVWSWGRGHRGQLGDGSTSDRDTPARLSLGVAVVEVTAGQEQSFAVTSSGGVLAWGANDRGQLGDGTTKGSLTPETITLPGSPRVVDIAGGAAFTAALTDDGQVFEWGAREITGGPGVNTPISAGSFDGARVVALAAGDTHILALDDQGRVWTWGDNSYGQLGRSGGSSSTPAQISLPASGATIAAAGSFSLALLSDGTLASWGRNRFGQLGDGTHADRSTPELVPGLAGAEIVGVAAGRDSVAVLVSHGPLATLTVSPANATVDQNVPQAYEVRGLDAFGDDLGPVAGATLSIQGGDCSGNACRAAALGRHTVTATSGSAVGVAILTVTAAGGGGGNGGGSGTPPPGGALGLTGLAIAAVVGVMIALLAVGVAAIVTGRRRRIERGN